MSSTVQIDGLDCVFILQTDTEPEMAVILCHGFGAPGTDLVPIAKEFISARPELANALFVFPQAPIELDPFYDSRAWWMIDIEKIQSMMAKGEVRELKNEIPAELPSRRQQIFNVIKHICQNYGLRSEQIVVGGFSQGAMLTTDVALNYPEDLAGLIVWSGALINETEWTQAAKTRNELRVVQSHGRLDPILPFVAAQHLRDMLLENKHKVEFIEFDGQHGIAPNAIVAAMNLISSVARSID